MANGNKPEVVFRRGAVQASVFKNNGTTKDGKIFDVPKVTLQVRYKDKEGNWAGTNSLGLNEIPKAILALSAAYNHIIVGENDNSNGNGSESDTFGNGAA